MRSRLFSLFVGLIFLSVCTIASAQDYPNRVIKLINANEPGATSDIMARIMASAMSSYMGQPMIVENKPGGGQTIAYEYVGKGMPADGYTLLFTTIDNVCLMPLTMKSLRFDPIKDLVPVIDLVEGRLALTSPANAPWGSFKEMVAYVKTNPGKLNYGSVSYVGQIPIDVFLLNLGLNMVRIPYRGGAGIITALMQGEISFAILNAQQAVAMGPKGKTIAITGEQRSLDFPDAATFGEIGFPQIIGAGFSLSVRAGTPRPIIDKIYSAATQALAQPDVKAALAKNYVDITGRTTDESAKQLAKRCDFFTDVAKQLGIKPE